MARNNYGSEYTQRYGSSRDRDDESSSNRGSQRDEAGRYDALGNYSGTSRNFSTGREHGYRDPIGERQDQTFNLYESDRGESRYGAGDYRSSPYENERTNHGAPGYGTQYATPGSSRGGGSPSTGSWGSGSYGSSEYGTNFRDSSSLGSGRGGRYGESYGMDRYPTSEDRYRGDRSDAWMGRSEHQEQGYRNAPHSRDASMYRNSGTEDRSWERSSHDRGMGVNRGSMPDYQTRTSRDPYYSTSNFGDSRYGTQMPNPRYTPGRQHMTGYGSEHRDASFNRYGTEDGGWESREGDSTWDDIRHSGQRMMQKVGEFFGVGPKGYTRSDSRIHDDVNDALMDDSDVNAANIEVNVTSGEVTLEGFVADRAMKRRAEDVAASCRGVKEVHNHLRTQPLSSSTVGDVHASSGLPQASTSMTSGLKTEATGDASKKADRSHKQIS